MANSFMKSIYEGYAAREKGNLKEAFEHFQNALEAEKDSPIAAFEVASFYEQGEIVPKDLEKAYRLYLQAAEGCVEMAQAKLAKWYEKGIHVEKNAATAKFWRERANEQMKTASQQPMTLAESIMQKITEVQNAKVPETDI
jgi:TPR repeat protein